MATSEPVGVSSRSTPINGSRGGLQLRPAGAHWLRLWLLWRKQRRRSELVLRRVLDAVEKLPVRVVEPPERTTRKQFLVIVGIAIAIFFAAKFFLRPAAAQDQIITGPTRVIDGTATPSSSTAPTSGFKVWTPRNCRWRMASNPKPPWRTSSAIKSSAACPTAPAATNVMRLDIGDRRPAGTAAGSFFRWCINRQADGGLELPIKVVQGRLGHASIQMTADRYGHLFPRGDDTAELAAAEQAIMAVP